MKILTFAEITKNKVYSEVECDGCCSGCVNYNEQKGCILKPGKNNK